MALLEVPDARKLKIEGDKKKNEEEVRVYSSDYLGNIRRPRQFFIHENVSKKTELPVSYLVIHYIPANSMPGKTTLYPVAILPIEETGGDSFRLYSPGFRSFAHFTNRQMDECSIEYSRYVARKYPMDFYESKYLEESEAFQDRVENSRDKAKSFNKFGVIDAEAFLPRKADESINRFVPFMYALTVPETERPPTVLSNG